MQLKHTFDPILTHIISQAVQVLDVYDTHIRSVLRVKSIGKMAVVKVESKLHERSR